MTYECIMCMETLESPAPTPSVALPEADGGCGGPNCPVHGPNLNEQAGPSRRKRNYRKSPSKAVDLRELCATHCGHMFHRACLDRWFSSQDGKKACPSCRKPLTLAKIFRLFPPGTISSMDDNTNNVQMSELEERSIPQSNCQNGECVQFQQVHRTLIGDYNNLLQKLADKTDNEALLAAQNASLEDELKRLTRLTARKSPALDISTTAAAVSPIVPDRTNSSQESPRLGPRNTNFRNIRTRSRSQNDNLQHNSDGPSSTDFDASSTSTESSCSTNAEPSLKKFRSDILSIIFASDSDSD